MLECRSTNKSSPSRVRGMEDNNRVVVDQFPFEKQQALWQAWAMNTLALELAQVLSELDDRSARALERLVRDAMELARPAQANGAAPVDARGWPVGYFEQTAGSFADEPFDLPDDPPPDLTPDPDC